MLKKRIDEKALDRIFQVFVKKKKTHKKKTTVCCAETLSINSSTVHTLPRPLG